jgi:hypothetical protein
MSRCLSKRFITDLKEGGALWPLLERVKADRTLCLEIREEYINIYYRGGNLLRVSVKPEGYVAFFDPEYASCDGGALSAAMPPVSLRSSEDVAVWVTFFPTVKLAMDLYLGRHPKEEREAQQNILRENNFGKVSLATDYFICDIEYANPHGRFDLVAVHWPSNSAKRKVATGRRLVLVEAKFGEGALDGSAGIRSHVNHINHFLSDPANVSALKSEMVKVFNQKRELGLIDCGKNLDSFSDEKPMLLLALVNHDPDSTILRSSLDNLPPSPHADIYLATSCFMGHGLFDQTVLPLALAKERLEALIYSMPKARMEALV